MQNNTGHVFFEAAEALAVADAVHAYQAAEEHLQELLDLAKANPQVRINLHVAAARTAVRDTRKQLRDLGEHL